MYQRVPNRIFVETLLDKFLVRWHVIDNYNRYSDRDGCYNERVYYDQLLSLFLVKFGKVFTQSLSKQKENYRIDRQKEAKYRSHKPSLNRIKVIVLLEILQ